MKTVRLNEEVSAEFSDDMIWTSTEQPYADFLNKITGFILADLGTESGEPYDFVFNQIISRLSFLETQDDVSFITKEGVEF